MPCHVFTHISSSFLVVVSKIPYDSRIAFLTVKIVELNNNKQANIKLFTLTANVRVYRKPIIFASVHQIVYFYAFTPRGNMSP